jgi:hypothetical protein
MAAAGITIDAQRSQLVADSLDVAPHLCNDQALIVLELAAYNVVGIPHRGTWACSTRSSRARDGLQQRQRGGQCALWLRRGASSDPRPSDGLATARQTAQRRRRET